MTRAGKRSPAGSNPAPEEPPPELRLPACTDCAAFATLAYRDANGVWRKVTRGGSLLEALERIIDRLP